MTRTRLVMLIAMIGMVSFVLAGCTGPKSDDAISDGDDEHVHGDDDAHDDDPANTDAANTDAEHAEVDAKWAHHTQGLHFTVGYETGLAKAKAAKKPALIFVTTTWCGYCKKLAGESFVDEEVQKRLDRFELVLVDGDEETDVCRELGVKGYPNIILKHEDGRTVGRVGGYVPKEQFIQIIDDALAAYDNL